jgi:hypothetical protein
MNLPASYEMQVSPDPGQLLLYIDLTELAKYRPIAEGIKQLELMGYTPQLRYSQWQDDSGIPQVSLFALLKDTHGILHDPDEEIGLEADTLHEAFPESMVVRCSWRPIDEAQAA